VGRSVQIPPGDLVRSIHGMGQSVEENTGYHVDPSAVEDTTTIYKFLKESQILERAIRLP
jgi:hypothetical protein